LTNKKPPYNNPQTRVLDNPHRFAKAGNHPRKNQPKIFTNEYQE
jgi:hypothetical protein